MPAETVLESNVKETDGPARNGDILGYARVSTAAQDAASQQDRLWEAGAIRVFVSRTRAAPWTLNHPILMVPASVWR